MDFPYQACVKKKITITNYKNFSPGSAKHHQIPVGIGLIGTGLRTVKKLIYWVNVLRLYVYQQSIHKLFLCLKYFQTDSVICLFNFCNKLPCLHGCIIKRLSLVHSRAANCLQTRKNERERDLLMPDRNRVKNGVHWPPDDPVGWPQPKLGWHLGKPLSVNNLIQIITKIKQICHRDHGTQGSCLLRLYLLVPCSLTR